MRKYKSAIFDLDGTLIDSLPGIASSLNEVLNNSKLPEQSLKAVQSFIGNGIEKLVERAIPGKLKKDKVLLTSLTDQLKKVYSSQWLSGTEVFDGIKETIAELQKNDIKTSIVTNKPDRYAVQIVRELFPETKFSFVIGAGEKFPKKPSPEAILYINRELCIPAVDTVLIGDSDIDIYSAINAGVFPLGVSWGYQSTESLRRAGCNQFVDKPPEILQLLNV